MKRLAVHCLLLTGLVMASERQHKRDLAYFQNILSSKLFGRRGQILAQTETPKEDSLPRIFNEVFIRAPKTFVTEEIELPGEMVQVIPIESIRSPVNCKNFDQIRSMQELHKTFSTVVDKEIDKDAITQEIKIDLPVYSLPEPREIIKPWEVDVKQILTKYAYKQVGNDQPVFMFTGNNSPTSEKDTVKVESVLPTPKKDFSLMDADVKQQSQIKTKYSYKQISNKQPVMVYTMNSGPGSVKGLSKTKSSPFIPTKVISSSDVDGSSESKYSYKKLEENQPVVWLTTKNNAKPVQTFDESNTAPLMSTNVMTPMKLDQRGSKYSYKQVQNKRPVLVENNNHRPKIELVKTNSVTPVSVNIKSPLEVYDKHASEIETEYSVNINPGLIKKPTKLKSALPMSTKGNRPMEIIEYQQGPLESKYSYTQMKNNKPVMVFTENQNARPPKQSEKTESILPMSVKERIDEVIMLGAFPYKIKPMSAFPPLEEIIYPEGDIVNPSVDGQYLTALFNAAVVDEFGISDESYKLHHYRKRPEVSMVDNRPHLQKPSVTQSHLTINTPKSASVRPVNNIDISQILGLMPPQYQPNIMYNEPAEPTLLKEKKDNVLMPLSPNKENRPHIVYKQKNHGSENVYTILNEEDENDTTNVKTNIPITERQQMHWYFVPPTLNTPKQDIETKEYNIKSPATVIDSGRPTLRSTTTSTNNLSVKVNDKSLQNNPIIVPNDKKYAYQQTNVDGSITKLQANKDGISVDTSNNNVNTNIALNSNAQNHWFFITPSKKTKIENVTENISGSRIVSSNITAYSPLKTTTTPKTNINVNDKKYLQNNPIIVPDDKKYAYQQTNVDGSIMKVKANKDGISVDQSNTNNDNTIIAFKTDPQNHWYFITPAVKSQKEIANENISSNVTASPGIKTYSPPKSTAATKTNANVKVIDDLQKNPIIVQDAKTYNYQQINTKDGSLMNVKGNENGVSVNIKNKGTSSRGDIPDEN